MDWWDLNTNGELQIISHLQNINCLNTVFDVGANHGEWSEQILIENPDCELHCFEICEETYSKLLNKKILSDWHKSVWSSNKITINKFGLYNEEKILEVNYCPNHEGLSSLYPIHWSSYWTGDDQGDWAGEREIIKCQVTKGKKYCDDKNIKIIDFLKIDTEGSELFVLKGFEEMLNPSTIKVIQFEYGKANICSRSLLIDYYETLANKGYLIGRLQPEGIYFKKYQYSDENFVEGNFICMNKEIAQKFT
jgi:FkbM family methyltransferase